MAVIMTNMRETVQQNEKNCSDSDWITKFLQQDCVMRRQLLAWLDYTVVRRSVEGVST